jgi:NAD(P)-dependent dehydrogenase (short-subunit alcohol dehydrogenase family)
MGLLDDKVAVISGIGPGLGQANAHALAREGAAVVLAARSADVLEQVRAEIVDAGGRAIAVPTNITDRAQCDALAQRAVDEFGRLDILVNNAFRASAFQSFENADLAKWRKIHDVNVWGSLELTQACVPALKDAAATHGDASIVFILSMSQRKTRADEIDYASSKAALHIAMRGLAYELGPSKVRVNAVAPGWIGGPSVEMYLGWMATERGVDVAVIRAEREAEIPLREIPPQDDIANSVVFFASPWSRVITGQTLDVNGGEFFG